MAKHCSYDYAPGQEVTLTASANAAGVRFVGWSDERCPWVGACPLRMDDDRQSVAALLAPQRIVVNFDDPGGTGTVSRGPGADCRRDPTAEIFDCHAAPTLSRVTLSAGGPGEATWDGTLRDPPDPGPSSDRPAS